MRYSVYILFDTGDEKRFETNDKLSIRKVKGHKCLYVKNYKMAVLDNVQELLIYDRAYIIKSHS